MLARAREVATEKGANLAYLLDTKGPEIRTAMLRNHEPIQLQAGQEVKVVAVGSAYTSWEGYQDAQETCIGVSYDKLCKSVKPGNRILMADGTIVIEVCVLFVCACIHLVGTNWLPRNIYVHVFHVPKNQNRLSRF